MRVVVPGQYHVRPGADIGGDRGLRAQVLPALLVDPDLHLHLVGELLRVLQEQLLIAGHELGRTQDPQFRPFLDLVGGRRNVRGDHLGPRIPAEKRATGNAGHQAACGQSKRGSTVEPLHILASQPLSLLAISHLSWANPPDRSTRAMVSGPASL